MGAQIAYQGAKRGAEREESSSDGGKRKNQAASNVFGSSGAEFGHGGIILQDIVVTADLSKKRCSVELES